MTVSEATQPDEVTEAEQAITEAQRRVGEVEQALIDGTPDVTAADLVTAEDDAERRRGIRDRLVVIARKRAEREAERRRRARITELRRHAEGLASFGPERFSAMVEALRHRRVRPDRAGVGGERLQRRRQPTGPGSAGGCAAARRHRGPD
jgi:hypothetical protein